MKKLFTILLVVAISFTLFGCSKKEEEPADTPEVSGERQKRVALISDSSMAGDFDQMFVKGFDMLEKEGWEVKIIEALESAEYEEDLYAMCEEGYELIYLKGDAIASVLIDVADDLHSKYPNVYFILADSYLEHDLDFATCVPVDPYESSFVGGYVAALSSANHEVAWIGHLDTINLARFRNGFTAGALYANPETTVRVAFTGDWGDPIKGQETTYAVHNEFPNVDVIDHAAYIAGNGVITACEELGIPCIGCDTYQTEKGATVFWNTIKSVDLMVYNVSKRWLNHEETSFGKRMSFNIASGSVPYDERDYNALPDDVKVKVDELMEGIKNGTVDVFYGDYAEFNLGY
ncbi:MAG: BMP family ABC transporter substrate-binding protein [Erysipelotrichaceae bacterium]|nr:BMP family ABC transporter substrate-binding protein [Erysipelotrichaceae bacterium]